MSFSTVRSPGYNEIVRYLPLLFIVGISGLLVGNGQTTSADPETKKGVPVSVQ